jgi:KRAB domain-containing zinc finger protein
MISHLPEEQRKELKRKQGQCSLCDFRSTPGLSMRDHMRNVHPKQDESHLCTICGKKFASNGLLRQHSFVHSNTLDFQCEQCPSRFKSVYLLRAHKKFHTEKKWSCDKCGRSFAKGSSLKEHKRIHTGERPYPCEWEGCDKRFNSSSKQRNHYMTHTGT